MNRSILVLAVLAIAANAYGDDCRDCACQRCGCQSHCRKICRVVCEMKDVKQICYSCKCEDFCVPGPSCKCGEICECDPCHSGCGCKCFGCLFGDGKIHRTIWKPSCESTLFTRNKLYKYEITKKVPTYKWVVEYCCGECQSATPCNGSQPVPENAPANSAESGSKPLPNSPITPPAELDMPQTAGLINGRPVQQAASWIQVSK
jgi:hypothetical protein